MWRTNGGCALVHPAGIVGRRRAADHRQGGRVRTKYLVHGARNMKRIAILIVLITVTALVDVRFASAGQAPAAASDPDIPISHRDRVYSAEQYSNTVSVTDPASNTLVGVIRLGDFIGTLSPLYRGQLLVHG